MEFIKFKFFQKMDSICRLCCSTKFVNNYIFDDENALFIKMSLYLPIKVLKNDQLPQKICDRCSCKVNDFYQFCNETIEVQNRLREIIISSKIATNESIDLTIIKQNPESPPPAPALIEKATQTDCKIDGIKDEFAPISPPKIKKENEHDSDVVCDTDFGLQDVSSDNSDEEFLINIKKKKRGRKCSSRNGEAREVKRGKKKKEKHVHWDMESQVIYNGCGENDVKDINLDMVKREEIELKTTDLSEVLNNINVRQKKDIVTLYKCCMCFEERDSRADMLQHYKSHARKLQAADMLPPPPPSGEPPRCLRCQKVVATGEWAEHWRRHYARDVRPYRCAVCYRAFRDHHHILKHGLTHTSDELRTGARVAKDEGGREAAGGEERFACDVCPLGFVYMRCLLSHRTRAHPEAASRALRVRCAVCARTFAHSNSLRRHLRAHSGERNFLCNVCGKALSSREHLKFHIRIHTGYKPHVCKTCGKGFVKKCNLTLHERVHSGEKPHVCSHCGKAFSQRSTLVIHERYHSGARPYSCGLCGRGFVAKGLLSMHLKSTCVSLPAPAAPPALAPLVRCHKSGSR